MDKLAQKRERERSASSKKLEVPLDKANFYFLLIFGFVIFGFLACSTFYLQAQGKEKYNSLSQQNKFINFNLAAERGVIYDRNEIPLVKNESTFDLWAKKSELPKPRSESESALLQGKEGADDIFAEVGAIIGKDSSFLKNLIIEAPQDDILIEKKLDHQQLVLLTTREAETPGFKIKKSISRHYESPISLSHVLGYLGKISKDETEILQDKNYEFSDSIGKEGVEKFYEDVLREGKGIVKFERTAQGKVISQQVVQYPSSGESLVLAIDSKLQKKAEEALRWALQESGAKKGVVVILDSSNGEILTSVSWPAFDNNLFAGGISDEDFKGLNEDKNNPQLNRAIAGLYPSGSAIKPIMGTAALEEGIITEKTSLYCPAKLCVAHQFDDGADCYPDNAYHGTSDIKRAIAESVNPFFFMIGGGYTAPPASSPYYDARLPRKFDGLGALKIAQYLNEFGFGQASGVDLPGEMEGRVPTPDWKEKYFKTALLKKWYLGDTYNLAIGQGNFLTTPLQLAAAFVPIANKGKMFRPKVAKEILSADGKKQEIPPFLIKENFISSATLRIIRAGMRQTVTSLAGSANYLNDLPVTVAAKTGTAQIYPNKDIYENWLVVFGPYAEKTSPDNEKPPIVMVVLIEEVPGLQKAAQRAGKEILQWYFYARYLKETPPSLQAAPALTPASMSTSSTTTENNSFSTTTINN